MVRWEDEIERPFPLPIIRLALSIFPLLLSIFIGIPRGSLCGGERFITFLVSDEPEKNANKGEGKGQPREVTVKIYPGSATPFYTGRLRPEIRQHLSFYIPIFCRNPFPFIYFKKSIPFYIPKARKGCPFRVELDCYIALR